MMSFIYNLLVFNDLYLALLYIISEAHYILEEIMLQRTKGINI
jgi:hypothetical protein